ncbi:DUF881 domain-containing protein, partial [Georgenia sp. 10Sc9-8]|nr:DUF881 domain-containing protein [Georgenia halotolerans]
MPGRGRPDASMSLLRDLLENPLDASYTDAAERRQGGRPGRPYPWWQKALVVLVCAVLGAGSVLAAKELRAPAEGRVQARALLEEQIAERTAAGDAMQEANAAAATEISDLQSEALEVNDQAFLDYLQDLAMAAGAVEVQGPGLELSLDDSRAAQSGTPGSEEGRVQDVDLQVIVNGLWSAGAEGIAINGHRLTTTSAVRSAGQAILVDLAPVVRPYTVHALGDPDDLEVGLARTNAAGHMLALRETYGITVEVAPQEDIVLPGSASRTLRYAEPAGTSGSGE